MSLLVDCAELTGRLKLLHDEPTAKDFAGEQRGRVRLIELPPEQDLDAEVEFLARHLPARVVVLGGEHAEGAPWVLTVERAPAASETGLDQLFERTLVGNGAITSVREWTVDPGELLEYYRWSIDQPKAVITLSFCEQLRGLAAEVCGYPIAETVARTGEYCAFPFESHDCQGEFFADIFQGWLDGLLQ